MDWIDVSEDGDRLQALVNVLLNLRVPKNPVTFLTSWELVSCPRRALVLCSYSHFVWAMSWTEFAVPIHDVIWFKVFPFITQYWNIFPCAMFVCWGVRWNAALLEGQQCVRKKRYRYWGTRCDEQLLACHVLTDGRTAIVLLQAGVTCFCDCRWPCWDNRRTLYSLRLGRLFAVLSPWIPSFDPGPAHVRFVNFIFEFPCITSL